MKKMGLVHSIVTRSCRGGGMQSSHYSYPQLVICVSQFVLIASGFCKTALCWQRLHVSHPPPSSSSTVCRKNKKINKEGRKNEEEEINGNEGGKSPSFSLWHLSSLSSLNLYSPFPRPDQRQPLPLDLAPQLDGLVSNWVLICSPVWHSLQGGIVGSRAREGPKHTQCSHGLGGGGDIREKEALITGRPRKHALIGPQRHSSGTIGSGSFFLPVCFPLLFEHTSGCQMTSKQKRLNCDAVTTHMQPVFQCLWCIHLCLQVLRLLVHPHVDSLQTFLCYSRPQATLCLNAVWWMSRECVCSEALLWCTVLYS